MPPRSPLPQRHGLEAAWVCTPERAQYPLRKTMGAWLDERLSEFVDVAGFLAQGRFVYETGTAVAGRDPYRPHTFVWFHRDLAEETFVPGPIHLIYRDDRIVVIDKPAFLSTIPRGRHVVQSVVVRLRIPISDDPIYPIVQEIASDDFTRPLQLLANEVRFTDPIDGRLRQFASGRTPPLRSAVS
ncbi:hypothetical protein [Cryobacterium sp. Y62]|uniref:hypothetical protein n=1 Tax=Cryobacterium sp. Y62 TaxID=2048284 RepID=UPI000CE40A80|nr:hypothetical protein [Cryobacterium sp. Y62]